MRNTLALLAALTLMGGSVEAQTRATILPPPGTRVRLTAESQGLHRAESTLLSATHDSLLVAVSPDAARDTTTLAIALARVDRLEVRTKASLSITGAVIGGLFALYVTSPNSRTAALIAGTTGAAIGVGGLRSLERGAADAAMVGLPLGIAWAAAYATTHDPANGCGWFTPCSTGEALVWGAAAGGFVGFVLGGVYGTLARGVWRGVPLDRPDASIAPYVTPGRLGVSATLRF
jgi:hypothetical protein